MFSIGAPQDYLRVGESIRLTALLRAPDGRQINPTDWKWVSQNPDVISVDGSGNVTGLKLGYGTIQVLAPAEAVGLFGSITIQVQPKNVTLSPSTANLPVGQTLQFSAVATDINDKPVPNPGFTWYVTTADGQTSLVPWNVTVAPDGTFTGGSAGTYTVHADIYYPIEYGKDSHFEALAQVNVTLPGYYSISRLVSSDPIPAYSLRPAPGFFTGGDSGAFNFTASADGLSTVAVSFSGGNSSALLETGTPNPQRGGVIAGFQQAAVNAGGDSLVAVSAGDVSNGALLATRAGGQPKYIVLDNSNGFDQNGNPVQQLTFLHLTRYSLNDNGDAVIRALYVPQDGTLADARNGLFLLNGATGARSAPVIPLLIWDESQALDATVPLSGTPARFTFAEDNTESVPGWMGVRGFGMDNNGIMYFMAQSGAARGLFQIRAGGKPQRILSVGDTYPGTSYKVKSIEDLVVTPAGDVAITVSLQGTFDIYLTFYKAGSLAALSSPNIPTPAFLNIPGTPNPRLLAASSAAVVFEGIPATGQKEGLYTWQPTAKVAASVLLLDSNTKYISSAVVRSNGAIVAAVETASNGFVLTQPGGANSFSSGPASAIPAYISFSNIVHGLRTALPSMLVSSPGSLFDLDGAGNTIARVITGDAGFFGTDRIVEDPSGVQYYASAGNLYRYTGGKATGIIGPGVKAPDGTLVTPVRAWSANGQGGVLVECGTNAADGHEALYLWRNNALTLMARNFTAYNGHQILRWTEAALDENNRAAVVYLEDDGSKDLVLTADGKTFTNILNTRASQVNNENVANLDHLRGASGGFWVRVAITADFVHAAAVTFSGPGNGVLLKSGDALPDGSTIGDFRLVDANSKGDIVLAGTVNTTGTQILVFRGADGTVRIVCGDNQQLPTGDYIARFSDINLRDDGTINFLAYDVFDRALVFQARPVSAAAPAISAGGVVPVGSPVPTIQPGEWVSIYGNNLAGSTAAWKGDFPTSLAGTSVTIGGKPAYISYVSPTLINVQVPNITATGSVPVVVTTANGNAAANVTIAQFAPSFSLLDARHVAGIIIRANKSGAYGGGTYDILGPTGSSLGYGTVAAKAGDTVELFAVGLGPTNPAVQAGQVFSGSAPTVSPVTLLINKISVTPAYAGMTSAGLFQINFTVPPGLGTGDVTLAATVGGAQTQSGVVMSLQ